MRNVGRAAEQLGSVADELDRAIASEFSDVGRRARTVFRQYAPRDTGNLRDSITVDVRGFGGTATRQKLQILAGAERDGYDYTKVTRYGHRRSIIRPVAATAMPIHWEGRHMVDAPVRRFARGYHPPRDWVDAAGNAIFPDLDQMADRVGRQVTRRIL